MPPTLTTPTGQVYYKGHVRHPQKDHLMAVSAAHHGARLQMLRRFAPPPVYDSRALGIVGPIKDQQQCGCHDSATEVLTGKGFVRWDDYDWQTPLGTMNPVTGMLEFQPPIGRHVYDYDGPMYYSDNRCVDFALTPNHRMYVRKWDEQRRILDDRYQFVEADKLGWYAGLPHATAGWLGTQLDKVTVAGRSYSGDDFLSLIALIISDGWAGAPSEGTKNQVGFCCFRDDRMEMVRSLAYRLGLHEQPNRPGYWLWCDGGLAEWMRQNAYDGDVYCSPFKYIPDLVKCTSQRQIELFLRFFGDQHIQADGTRRFYSSSRRMIDDLQELLLRIGRRGTIEERSPRQSVFRGRRIESRGPDLTLTERRTERLSLVRKKNVRTDHYKGKVYCATVSNGLLVTRRNKSTLISGNSCWDFSGTCVIEVAFYLAKLLKPDGSDSLSEEYTLSCGRNGGCNGDDNVSVLEWAKKTGLPKTSDYGPYSAQAGRCAWKQGMTLYKIDDYVFADPQAQGQSVASTPAIQAAIMQYGCVGCAVAAGGSSFWNSGQGVDTGTSRSIDHDVALVGWKTVGNKVIWIMRNSWNTKWGDKCANDANPNPTEAGYAWVQEGADQIGTEAVAAIVHNPNPPEPPDWLP